MRLVLDVLRTEDGRWEGAVSTETGQEHPFSGTLDLLRVLEELGPPTDPRPAGDDPGRPR